MAVLLLTLINFLYFFYLAIASLFFELCLLLIFPFFILLRRGRVDDFFRIHNWAYGLFVVKMSRPFFKVEISGLENIPKGPLVAVFNHRAYADIFFTALLPVSNMLIVVRDWPFRKLFGLNVFMRLASYFNIERMNADELLAKTKEFAARGVSFQIFPEGHKSKDGSLQKFKSGAFLVALANNLPLLPVCMDGIEKIQRDKFPFIHPGLVRIRILPPLDPAAFSGDLGALRMRKHVRSLFLEVLGR